MKKSKAEAEQTRLRIVAAAADEVRRKGLAEANMGEVMSAAGLTHGGFYRHFSNREQLFEEGLQQAMAASGKMMADRAVAGGISNAIKGLSLVPARDEAVPRCPYARDGVRVGASSDVEGPGLGGGLFADRDTRPKPWR